jgi:hypothetical protein
MNTSDEARTRIAHTGRMPDVPPSNPFEGTAPNHTAEVRVLFVYTEPADPRLVSGVLLDLHVKTEPSGDERAAVLLHLEARGQQAAAVVSGLRSTSACRLLRHCPAKPQCCAPFSPLSAAARSDLTIRPPCTRRWTSAR